MKKMTVEKAKAELQAAMRGPAGRHWNYGPAVSAVLEALEQAAQRIAELQKWVRGVEEAMISASDRAESAEKRVAELTAERDALREGEMGDAKHSNTRAAADIYFQLVEECEIPSGGSLVEHVDDMRERIGELEARTLIVRLPGGFSREIFGDGMYEVPNGNWMHRKDVTAAIESACAAAGIKLQIEGE